MFDDLADRVIAFLGEGDHQKVLAHVQLVTEFVRAYTRGNGFTNMIPEPDVEAAIVTATARSLTNPGGVVQSVTSGPFTESFFKFDGFSLMEQAVLNKYRRRTA